MFSITSDSECSRMIRCDKCNEEINENQSYISALNRKDEGLTCLYEQVKPVGGGHCALTGHGRTSEGEMPYSSL